MAMQPIEPLPSSYRDNAGFVFKHNNKIYRLINENYFGHYDMLLQSGLYKELTTAGRLIKHEEIPASSIEIATTSNTKIIFPAQLPFISYPYEWSFDMWKDAAIVTLKIVQVCLQKGMILKDATPFNIQFYNGRPVFIDTLSFEKYTEGKTWIAYRQFCECFLSPLLLMYYGHRDMGKLFVAYPDGIPLEITKSLLPLKSALNIHVYMHVWLQSRVSVQTKNKKDEVKDFSKQKLELLIKGLLEFVISLTVKKNKSTWDDYYTDTILGNNYLEHKSKLVKEYIDQINFKTVIDLGANDGYFSMLLQEKASNIISVDFDSNCVNDLYKSIRKNNIKNIVPIVAMLNTPSPAVGWANEERTSLTERLKADLIMALALVHHLAISNNVTLANISDWLQNMGEFLIVEFVPKADEKVQELLLHRKDIFTNYTLQHFKDCFALHFNILQEETVGTTERTLFLMQKKYV